MDDDEIFERSMASLGVEPLDGERRLAGLRRAAALEEEERRLFEEAMRELDGPAPADRRVPGATLPAVRKVKARPEERIGDQIDLHRLKSADALRRLEGFVAEARRTGVRTVLVITGKGHHSPGGRSVLRHQVEEWALRKGRRSIRAYSVAPRALGGRGAYVLYLRPFEAPG